MVSIADPDANYSFPEGFELQYRLRDVLETEVDESYYLSSDTVKSILDHCYKKATEGCGYRPYFQTRGGVSGTITAKIGSRQTDTYLIEPVGPCKASKRAIIYRCGHSVGWALDTSNITTSVTEHNGKSRHTSTSTMNSDIKPIFLGNCLNPNLTGRNFAGATWHPDGISPTINTFSGGNRQPMILTQSQDDDIESVRYQVRKLTPRECFRLMDVDDERIDRIQQVQMGRTKKKLSNTQQYKLAGNSIVVNCLYHIFKNLFINQ